MSIFKTFFWLGLCWLPTCFANTGANISQPVAKAAASGNILNWSLGLLVVLAIFFLCVWGLRKLGSLSVTGSQPMRIIGGLSLGMREKVVLVQVGNKQLILGVTPGRIQTLHILENGDCLSKEQAGAADGNSFAQKLLLAMKGQSDA